jgi:hypothetical protein
LIGRGFHFAMIARRRIGGWVKGGGFGRLSGMQPGPESSTKNAAFREKPFRRLNGMGRIRQSLPV